MQEDMLLQAHDHVYNGANRHAHTGNTIFGTLVISALGTEGLSQIVWYGEFLDPFETMLGYNGGLD